MGNQSVNLGGGLFQQCFERARSAAFVVDLRHGARFGRLAEVNEAFADLVGRPLHELLGTAFVELAVGEDRELFGQDLRELAAGPVRPRMEMRRRLCRADGRPVDSRLDVTPVRDDAGQVVLALVQIENLDEFESTERLARTSEQRYRRAFVDAPFPLAWVVAEGPDTGRFTGANAAMCALTGYTEAELVALPVGGLTHPDEIPLHQGRFRKLVDRADTSTSQMVRHVRRKDGTSLWARLSFAVQRNEMGGIEHGMIHAEDITEARTAELALSATRERLHRSFDHAPIGTVLIDVAAGGPGRIIEANPAAANLFGYARDRLTGMLPADLVHPDDRGAALALLGALAAGDQVVRRVERRYLHASGREIVAEVNISLVHDHHGQPAYAIAQIVDVTEHRAVEARLRQAERLESVGHLAGGVAHDVNNLLAGIMSYADLIAMSIGDLRAVDAGQQAAFDRMVADTGEIVNVSLRGAELTRQLLVLSRRDAVILAVLDVNAVVEGVRSLVGRTIGEHIDLRFEPGPGLHAVKADEGQLEQVLLNLVVNARDAMRDGGCLTIRTTNVVLGGHDREPGRLPDGQYVCLSVADTGEGMPPEVVTRAFEPFFTTKPLGVGSGLGLATVYGIVTDASGEVSIESTPGAGTTIRVLLPATVGVPESKEAAPVAEARLASGQNVLLVEDEATVREPTERLLRRWGFHVVAAATADAAVTIAERAVASGERIDVLITDVVLPGRSGPNLVAELSAAVPDLKVLYISGYSQDHFPGGVLPPGVHLVRKPFSGPQLIDTLWTILDTDGQAEGGSAI